MKIADDLMPVYARLAAFRSQADCDRLSAELDCRTSHSDGREEALGRGDRRALSRRRSGPSRRANTSNARSSARNCRAAICRRSMLRRCTRVADVLVKAGFAESRRAAERLISGKGVKVDGIVVTDPRAAWSAAGRPFFRSVRASSFASHARRKRTNDGGDHVHGRSADRRQKFVCKRCKRDYPYPQAGERPIRCECGWWYYNDGAPIREASASASSRTARRSICAAFSRALGLQPAEAFDQTRDLGARKDVDAAAELARRFGLFTLRLRAAPSSSRPKPISAVSTFLRVQRQAKRTSNVRCDRTQHRRRVRCNKPCASAPCAIRVVTAGIAARALRVALIAGSSAPGSTCASTPPAARSPSGSASTPSATTLGICSECARYSAMSSAISPECSGTTPATAGRLRTIW